MPLDHGVADGGAGTDVLHHAADVHGEAAGGDGASGEGVDELFFAALRIADVERHDGHAVLARLLVERGDGVRLVLLDAEEDAVDAEYLRGDGGAFEDRFGAFEHETVVGGEVGLAFRAVQDERVDDLFGRGRELYVGRERRAAHADDAGVGDALFEDLAVGVLPVRDRVEAGAPFVLAVGNDLDGRDRAAVGAGNFDDVADRAAGGRVDRGGDESAGLGDELPLLHRVALLDDGLRRRADVLLDGDGVAFEERGALRGNGVGKRFAVGGMDAAVKTPGADRNIHLDSSFFCAGSTGLSAAILRWISST